MADKAGIIICGGGIIGLTIAKELLDKGHKNIVILEKEKKLGEHASGRNSGILHAGIYYSPDSLKARFCLEGNFLMKDYCRKNNIPILESGKVIVAKNEEEIPALEELYNRALKNGAKVEIIDEKKIKTVEPYAKTCRQALFSHYTAVVDPSKVLEALERDLISSGKVMIMKGIEFRELIKDSRLRTNKGSIEFDLFINAAGCYSDKVAHEFGVGYNYKIIPFKGTYKKLKKEKSYLVRGNIYPVPDIRNPFLGVHFTRSIEGTVYIGPTAITALGRENYGILSGIDREVFNIICRNITLLLTDPLFRKTAHSEIKKYIPRFFFEDANSLIESLQLNDIEYCSKVGIRAQLVDWGNKNLVMDFVVLKKGNSLHILNAISPGFTSSMAFAKFIANNL